MSKLIIANGPFLPPSQSVLFQAAADQWSRLVDAWLQNEHAPDREALFEGVAQYKQFIDPAKLAEALQMLPEMEKEPRVVILYQIDRLARVDHLPNEQFWQMFSDAAFQQSMLKTLLQNKG